MKGWIRLSAAPPPSIGYICEAQVKVYSAITIPFAWRLNAVCSRKTDFATKTRTSATRQKRRNFKKIAVLTIGSELGTTGPRLLQCIRDYPNPALLRNDNLAAFA
jgi:hypothetical protein